MSSQALGEKAISGIFWSFLGRFGDLGFQFIVMVIISRILSPSDYGVIGMLTVFTALGAVILESGFGQALIRKQDADNIDYSSVFYTNIVVGIVIYLIAFGISPRIADFYKIPELKDIGRVLFLIFPINSIMLIQNTILTKKLDYKSLLKVSIISSFLSGLLAVFLAYKGIGVWTLVIQILSLNIIKAVLLWTFNDWRPLFVYSVKSMKSLLSLSLNLLGSGFIVVVFNNLYTLLIGKMYSSNEVGYYNQAKRIEEIPTLSITTIIQNVSYSVLVKVQNDDVALKLGYKKVISFSVFIVAPLLIYLLVSAPNFIVLLLTSKWQQSIPIFQILCVYGALFPLHSININILKIKNKGKIILRLELLRRGLMIISILLTYMFDIQTMLIGYLVAAFISIVVNMHCSGRVICYSLREQFSDIMPYYLISICAGGVSFVFLKWNNMLLSCLFQFVFFYVLYGLLCWKFKLKAFCDSFMYAKIYINKILK